MSAEKLPLINRLLTSSKARLIVTGQFHPRSDVMSNSSFKTLDSKVDELIKLCTDLKRENQILRDKENLLRHERTTLLDKNQLARVRLEKVLRRLKTLEEGQE